jgi:hypothetical protein
MQTRVENQNPLMIGKNPYAIEQASTKELFIKYKLLFISGCLCNFRPFVRNPTPADTILTTVYSRYQILLSLTGWEKAGI